MDDESPIWSSLPVLPWEQQGHATYHPSALSTIGPHEFVATQRLEEVGLSPHWREVRLGKNIKNPDIWLEGKIWDIKAPTGNTENTISRQFLRAHKQGADSVVIDSTRTELSDEYVQMESARRLLANDWFSEVIVIGGNEVIRLTK